MATVSVQPCKFKFIRNDYVGTRVPVAWSSAVQNQKQVWLIPLVTPSAQTKNEVPMHVYYGLQISCSTVMVWSGQLFITTNADLISTFGKDHELNNKSRIVLCDVVCRTLEAAQKHLFVEQMLERS